MPATAPSTRAAWWASVTLFLVHGLVVSSWVSRIPAVQSALRIRNGVLGLTLLSAALGAVFIIPSAGWLVSRYGSKIVTILSSIAFCLSVILPGVAKSPLTLGLALFVYGGTAATMDVSMNAQGVEVEKHLGSPTMSRFHAMFSLGGMIGAAIGGALAARQITPLAHFSLTATVCIPLALTVSPFLLTSDQGHTHTEHRLPLRKIPAVLLALSAIGFCILLCEGAMADWIAVYLRQVLQADSGTAAFGYSVFSAAMATFRFLGDWITKRLGPLRTVRFGSLVGAIGVLFALIMPSPIWAMPGFAAAGAGFSVIIPLVFGSGGRVRGVSPGPGIATVTGLGYIGFIVGPPVIGFASQLSNLRYGLGVVVLCCLISAALASLMRELEAAPTFSSHSELHLG